MFLLANLQFQICMALLMHGFSLCHLKKKGNISTLPAKCQCTTRNSNQPMVVSMQIVENGAHGHQTKLQIYYIFIFFENKCHVITRGHFFCLEIHHLPERTVIESKSKNQLKCRNSRFVFFFFLLLWQYDQ